MESLKPRLQPVATRLPTRNAAHGWQRNDLTPKRKLSGSARQKRNERIKLRDGYTCQECGSIRLPKELEVDHRIPICDGGSEHDSNLQSLCAEPCHRNKTEREQRHIER